MIIIFSIADLRSIDKDRKELVYKMIRELRALTERRRNRHVANDSFRLNSFIQFLASW